jgi:hypothetical protein
LTLKLFFKDAVNLITNKSLARNYVIEASLKLFGRFGAKLGSLLAICWHFKGECICRFG